MQLTTGAAFAYINHGRWIADCPRPYCGNALALTGKQTQFHCSGQGGCQLLAEVVWPVDADEIWAALKVRPVPTTRNWAPAGHRQAISCHVPDGQTVADLIAETHEHEDLTQIVGAALVSGTRNEGGRS